MSRRQTTMRSDDWTWPDWTWPDWTWPNWTRPDWTWPYREISMYTYRLPEIVIRLDIDHT